MVKLLLIVVVFAAAYFIMRSYVRSLTRKPDSGPAKGNEDMVQCRHCGLHLPRSESLKAADGFFCSEEHRRLHGS